MGNRGVSLSSVSLIQPIVQIILTLIVIRFSQSTLSDAICKIEPQHRYLILITSLSFVLTIFTVRHALLALPMAIAIVMLGSVPFISAVLAHFFLEESLNWFTIFTMVISFCALVVLALGKDENLIIPSDRNGTKYNN